MNNLTALRKAILKSKDITPEALFDLGQWFQYLAALKAKQLIRAKKALKKKK